MPDLEARGSQILEDRRRAAGDQDHAYPRGEASGTWARSAVQGVGSVAEGAQEVAAEVASRLGSLGEGAASGVREEEASGFQAEEASRASSVAASAAADDASH